MFRLLLKNILRNKRRAFLTWSGVAVSLFLLASLAVVYSAMGEAYRGADTSPRLMVRRSVGLTMPLPERYGDRIRQVPGVAIGVVRGDDATAWKKPPPRPPGAGPARAHPRPPAPTPGREPGPPPGRSAATG